ncbi:MAG: efflux RND transporter periplasmic adaptor subunit [bacterium]|nr:efflux RND transporter periplasmic adaptor subunit [bacterium]
MMGFFTSHKRAVLIVAVILLIIGTYMLFRSPEESTNEFLDIELTDIVQEISVTGRVQATESVNLAFEKSGRIASISADVGDTVGRGAVLVQQNNADLRADLAEAQANLKAENARLSELQRGTRPEEVEIARVKVANQEQVLVDAKLNAIDKMRDAFTRSDDGIRKNIDSMFTGPRSDNPQLVFSPGVQGEINIETARFLLELLLERWEDNLLVLNSSSDMNVYFEEAKSVMGTVRDLLDLIASAINGTVGGISTATQSTYQTDTSTARTSVNTGIINMSAAEEKFRQASSSLSLAKEELILAKAGTTAEEILRQEANVESAQARVDGIGAEIAKTIIRTPISGIVTRQDATVGEIVAANINLVSVIGTSGFEMEANVPESDISNLKLEDSARVTLDAYTSDDIFMAHISKIDPAETVIEGVATYKVTLVFDERDERIRSGMTANIDIRADEKKGVIAIPARAVVSKDGKKFVRVVSGDSHEEVVVTTGLRGSEGTIEITSGLSVGDKIIVFVRE